MAALLGAVRAAQLDLVREKLYARPVLSCDRALGDYLSVSLAHLSREVARVIYLNAANQVLRDESCGEGSPVEVIIHPREVLRRALELGATALILAHNHPSGDPAPSQADIDATRRLARSAALLDIVVHDHVIVTSSGRTSLRAMGLL